jgi:hypothetical protein
MGFAKATCAVFIGRADLAKVMLNFHVTIRERSM